MNHIPRSLFRSNEGVLLFPFDGLPPRTINELFILPLYPSEMELRHDSRQFRKCSFEQRGFTLVELAIVLGVIGLIVGAVVVGRTLIRSSELRSIVSAEQRYVTSVNTFKLKYSALPGDMRNAAALWGIAGGTTGDNYPCQSVSSTDSKTCNGDGDGNIGTTSSTAQVNERFRFWQHLTNAGLLNTQFTGTGGSAGEQQSIVGQNVPSSSISGLGWQVKCTPDFNPGDTTDFAGLYRNYLYMGATVSTNNSLLANTALTAQESWDIDTKLDDGKPATGKVIGGYWDRCTTASSNTDTAARYLSTYGAKNCNVYYVDLF